MAEEQFDSVDESLRRKFEAEWVAGRTPEIADFLPLPDDGLYLGTLEELVHIDLEFRWKQFGVESSGDRPPRIEYYLERFPRLATDDVCKRLVLAEFELRSINGDAPEAGEYERRFGEMAERMALRSLLEEQGREIRVEVRPPKPGEQVDRYCLVAEQGRGGFGAVWRADDTKLGRRIALKRLSAQLTRQAEARRRFISEARITANLEHPGIIPIYDMSQLDEPHAYYTMRLILGGTLADEIERVHRLPKTSAEYAVRNRRLLNAFVDICQTIEYCHSRNVVHRDLKPQNIILGKFGETIVIDWGLACLAQEPDQVADRDGVEPLAEDASLLSSQESMDTLTNSCPSKSPAKRFFTKSVRLETQPGIYDKPVELERITRLRRGLC